jgi:hypothetical protein
MDVVARVTDFATAIAMEKRIFGLTEIRPVKLRRGRSATGASGPYFTKTPTSKSDRVWPPETFV